MSCFSKDRWRLAIAILVASAPSRDVAGQAPAVNRAGYSKADVEFMQGMIAHHAQAITMSSLVPRRTERVPIRMLAERITVSQRDEIKMMRSWLLERNEVAPNPLGRSRAQHPHTGHDSLMPGMLTAERLDQLRAARGAEFERLLLESMIYHHEGAITMVTTLFATPGAGQDLSVYRLASDIEADQRAEIARMRALLKP